MQTEQTTSALAAFQHRTRQPLPQALAEGAPAPPTWIGSQDEWDVVAADARLCHSLRSAYDFASAIALLGYFPDELATGTLRPGAKIQAMSGLVVRPPAPQISRELAEACQRALQELVHLNVTVDPMIQQALEFAAWYRRGDERDVQRKLRVAERAVNERRAVLEAKRRSEASMPVLIVRRPFRAKGGRIYERGRYKITDERLGELKAWQDEMEAQAAERGWDSPNGYGVNDWPPFSFEQVQV